MEDQKTTSRKVGHIHKEAYCNMTYECEICEHHVRIWNSRDGVTPFMVKCRHCKNGMMQHIDWEDDTQDTNHLPLQGQLVFVTQTKEEHVALREKRAAAIWASEPDCRDSYASLEEFQELFSSSGYTEGQPTVRKVGLVPWEPEYKSK